MNTEYESGRINLIDGRLSVDVTVKQEGCGARAPRLGVLFRCGDKTRRMPLICDTPEAVDGGVLRYSNRFILSEVFYCFKAGDTTLELILENGKTLDFAKDNISLIDGVTLKDGALIISGRLMNKKTPYSLGELAAKETPVKLIFFFFNLFFSIYKKLHPVKGNRISFMSGRRTSLDGNMKYVYDELKGDSALDIKTLLFIQSSGYQFFKNTFKFMKLYATSRAVVVDDFFRLLSYFDKPKDTRVFQLWHACGAFKTFGYSRIGKVGAPSQRSANHRVYDCAIVSSGEVARHYAEGFGISDSCIKSTGVPRCDVFFDKAYGEEIKRKLYEKYPLLNNKRVLLFAPTFRGNGQQSAYYPVDKLDLNRLCGEIGEEWAVIIKLHPFCKERFEISEALRDRVIDLSNESELNDLLFITDLLVTDYSSAVFEASLLDIPMLFYAFDLEEYIRTRDFYYSFRELAPGKTVSSEEELIESVNSNDFESEKIETFKTRFFDYTDSGSSKRAAEEIAKVIRG